MEVNKPEFKVYNLFVLDRPLVVTVSLALSIFKYLKIIFQNCSKITRVQIKSPQSKTF